MVSTSGHAPLFLLGSPNNSKHRLLLRTHFRYLWLHQSELKKGSRVLELGAGTALPGLLLAKLGHQVTLSDSLVLPHTLDNCREAAKCNELQEKVQVKIIISQRVSSTLETYQF